MILSADFLFLIIFVKSDARQLVYISTQFVILSSFFKIFCFETIYSFFIILTKLTTEQCRNSVADCCYRYAFISICFCRACILFDMLCRVNRKYLKCKKCYRKNRKCNLISDYQKIDKIIKKTEKLNNKITELRLKIVHKIKQKKHWFCYLKDINNAESKNILKIEKNKKKIKNTKKISETLSDININLFLFAFLSSDTLFSFISNFVADKTVAAYQSSSSDSWVIFIYS